MLIVNHMLASIRNQFLFGFHIVRARLAGEDHVCVHWLCEAVDRELSKPFFVIVILSAPGYRVSLWMLERHILQEGGILRNTPKIVWADNRLHVPSGVSQTCGGRVYFEDD